MGTVCVRVGGWGWGGHLSLPPLPRSPLNPPAFPEGLCLSAPAVFLGQVACGKSLRGMRVPASSDDTDGATGRRVLFDDARGLCVCVKTRPRVPCRVATSRRRTRTCRCTDIDIRLSFERDMVKKKHSQDVYLHDECSRLCVLFE